MNYKRILTGFAFLIIWVVILLLDNFWLLWLTCLALGGVMINEFYNMVLRHHEKKDRLAGTMLALLPLIVSYKGDPEIVAASLFVSLLLLIFYTLNRFPALCRDNSNDAGLDLMLSLGFGVFYVGFCGSHFAMIMAKPLGVNWLIWITLMIAASDTGAYYTGKLMGKTKLCPSISPGKTREGFLGGMIFTVSVSVAFSMTVFDQLPMTRMIPLTIIIFCVGVIGDLTVSIIKRSMGVKDSGNSLPGHGGILDRLDSVLLTIPILFYLLHFGFLPPSP